MSTILESALDAERRADCAANDDAMRTMTRAYLGQPRDPADEKYPTTRSYHRSMATAFPDLRAQCFEPHVRPPLWVRAWRAFWRWA